MKVAVVGCGHGNLDLIYAGLVGKDVDLLIICGDFEACRNEADLDCLAGPAKYHVLKDYWKYYKGDKVAPILTIFIGGNHEASNHLWELYYGGWVAPNIYFLGYSGVVNVGDLRIGGISGIHSQRDYRKGHMERLPYSESYLRSIYHTRECEIWRMKCLMESERRLDIMISHDWPEDIALCGDTGYLFRRCPHFKESVDKKEFGSPALLELVKDLKPRKWFSGHMHVKYQANYVHGDKSVTDFRALDKAIPGRQGFMDILDFPEAKAGGLRYDEEWIGVLRATHDNHFFGQSVRLPRFFPTKEIATQREEVRKIFGARELDSFVDPSWFEITVPAHPQPTGYSKKDLPKEFTENMQSVKFISTFGIGDKSSSSHSKPAKPQQPKPKTEAKPKPEPTTTTPPPSTTSPSPFLSSPSPVSPPPSTSKYAYVKKTQDN